MIGQSPSLPHTPLQQSAFSLQTSPPPRQVVSNVQRIVPPMSSQLPEQQAPSPLQASPAGTQVEPASSHVPPLPQELEQHSALSVQSSPTIAHIVAAVQTPPTQPSEQHSSAVVQA